MKALSLLAAFGSTILLASSARAQIVWNPLGPSSITGPSDISTLGTFVDAITPHSITTYGNTPDPSSLTVGDTTFNIGSLSDSTFSLTSSTGVGDGGDGNGVDGLNTYESLVQQPPTPASADQANYNEILTHCAYSGTAVTVTMSGLIFGDTYQVEIWNSTPRQTTYTSGSNTVTLTGGDFVTGEFVAPLSGQETFSYLQSGSNDLGVISDIALREIPEPSTYAMLFGGLGLLVLVARFRSKLTA